ncbi:MAG TPA: hypothetical protein VJ839_04260, partial [Candidatus Limnocylindria bacterium]|nr:hypothetical protein [Candidatus Limnocylindria bacterium]
MPVIVFEKEPSELTLTPRIRYAYVVPGASPAFVRLCVLAGNSPSLCHVPAPMRRQISHFCTGPPPLPFDQNMLIELWVTVPRDKFGAAGAERAVACGSSDGRGMKVGIGEGVGS